MKTILYFYTGIGNSLWTARMLSAEIDESELRPMPPEGTERNTGRCSNNWIDFPVHIWGLPRRVVEFVTTSIKDPLKYYFAIAVDASQVAATLHQLRKMLERQGAVLSAGYEISMPSNYIPWGGPGPEGQRKRKFDAAESKIKKIADVVRSRGRGPVEKGPLWQRVIFSVMYRLTFERMPGMDKNFWTDPRCNGCGVCEQVCPNGNVRLEGGSPSGCTAASSASPAYSGARRKHSSSERKRPNIPGIIIRRSG